MWVCVCVAGTITLQHPQGTKLLLCISVPIGNIVTVHIQNTLGSVNKRAVQSMAPLSDDSTKQPLSSDAASTWGRGCLTTAHDMSDILVQEKDPSALECSVDTSSRECSGPHDRLRTLCCFWKAQRIDFIDLGPWPKFYLVVMTFAHLTTCSNVSILRQSKPPKNNSVILLCILAFVNHTA